MPCRPIYVEFNLKSYFFAILAANMLTLAVKFDLFVVYVITSRKDGMDDLLAGDVLYLST